MRVGKQLTRGTRSTSPRGSPARSVSTGCNQLRHAPGFINFVSAATGSTRRLRRWPPTRGSACRAGAAPHRRDRLQRAERRQGDARRPPAQHDHRRRAGRACSSSPAHADPAEPRRRLGDAVRDADRAPPTTRAGTERPARRSSDLDALLPRRRGRAFDSDPAFAERARERVVALQARRRRHARALAAAGRRVQASLQRGLRLLGVRLTDADLAGESATTPLLAGVVDELDAQRASPASHDGAVCVFPTASPAATASRCR